MLTLQCRETERKRLECWISGILADKIRKSVRRWRGVGDDEETCTGERDCRGCFMELEQRLRSGLIVKLINDLIY